MVKKHKKKSKQESKKRSKNTTKPKIYRKTFIIDNDIVGLYKYIKKMKLNPKHNFVDFKTNRKDNKITFVFQSKINHKYNSNPKWTEIKCKEESLGNLTIKTLCDIKVGEQWITADRNDVRRYKTFVKGVINFYDYIMKIKKNKISKTDHHLLFNKLIDTQILLMEQGNQYNLINHNLDVKTLHFKFK